MTEQAMAGELKKGDLAARDLIAIATAEVSRLHDFFGAWFRAEVANSEASFRAFAGAMGDGFTIIGPDGEEVGREALVTGLQTMHGAYRDSRPPFRIEIRNPRGRYVGSDFCLVTYQEWQTVDGEKTGRISTAILRADSLAPGRMLWLNVHETWIT